jgi:hypothetical protein
MKTVELRFVTASLPSPSAILTGAADLIEQRGWKQRQGLSNTGAVDAIGAMRLAVATAIGLTGLCAASEIAAGVVEIDPEQTGFRVGRRFDAAVHLVAERIGARVDERIDSESAAVCRWHDRHGRTATEVIAVLRDAAALHAESQEDPR